MRCAGIPIAGLFLEGIRNVRKEESRGRKAAFTGGFSQLTCAFAQYCKEVSRLAGKNSRDTIDYISWFTRVELNTV